MDERLLSKDILVFDVGNVLVRFDPKIIVKGYFPPDQQGKMLDAIWGSGLWGIIDTGLMHTGELARKMCEAAHTDDVETFRTVARLLDTFYLHECPLKMSRELPRLKEMGKTLYYLSNYSSPAFENTMSRFDFFKCFDGGVVSSHEHICKPARRIYEILCERYHFDPHDALFVDDTLENVEAAQAAGFDTLYYPQGRTEPVDD